MYAQTYSAPLGLAVAIALLLPALSAAQVSPPVVKTPEANFQGVEALPSVDAFLGIPYAEPPVGLLRFQPPRRLNETSGYPRAQPNGTTLTTGFGPVCHQVHYDSPMLPQNLRESVLPDEDCLTLNIWRPSSSNLTESKLLPVMIWVHGGAFSEGGGSVPIYNPQHLVEQNPSVIVVTINYRLGIFGFPISKVRRGNLGLLDQRTAVEWIRDYIGYFGGDPARMILFGESAGAVSISAYSYTYKDDPIVNGLIQQSGVATGIGDADGTTWTLAATAVGCNDTENPVKEFDCMMALPAAALTRAVSNASVNSIGSPNGGSPFVDNVTVFSIADYTAKAEAGDFAKIPVLLGTNNNEGNGVVNYSPEYGLNTTLADAVTIAAFTCPVSQLAGQLRGHGIPVWRYRYMPVFPSVTFYPFSKTYHTSEIPIVLGSFRSIIPYKTPTEAEIQASKLLQRAWVSFARDPHRGLRDEMGWPLYNASEPTLITLFTNNEVQVNMTDPGIYDGACANAPAVSWTDLAAPAPGPPA
ncbi:hypothetical protein CLAIMM_02454 [Cladophialophora immunda]|nr:hypothetical protein CLAIMM_02454 [Cladophialophora immunda]